MLQTELVPEPICIIEKKLQDTAAFRKTVIPRDYGCLENGGYSGKYLKRIEISDKRVFQNLCLLLYKCESCKW